MNITKQELLDTMQVCVNTYMGHYGKIVPLENQIIDRIGKEKSIMISGWKDNDFYIAFRGTRGLKEWIGNFKFFKKEIKKNKKIDLGQCKVHEGFYKHWKMVKPFFMKRLTDNIDKIKENKSHVYIEGHSLGGPTAILSSFELIDYLPKNDFTIVTYASPRLFSIRSARKYNKFFKGNIFRVILHNDMVPKVPMTRLNYKHVGELIWLKKPKLWERILIPFITTIGNPMDHFPQKYLEAIDEL